MGEEDIEALFRQGGVSFGKSAKLIELLFSDSDRLINEVRDNMPKYMITQLKRENERLRQLVKREI